MSNALRKGLPPLPERVARLPVSEKGYPIPFFVAYPDGKPDFRVIDPKKVMRCIMEGRCWVCGETLGAYKAFVGGPLMLVNNFSGEPPSHRDCGEFSATACPHLVLPHASRREANMPEGAEFLDGHLATRPPATLLYITKSYLVQRLENGYGYRMQPPTEVIWYKDGKLANNAEATQALKDAVNNLRAAIGEEAWEREQKAIMHRVAQALEHLPKV